MIDAANLYVLPETIRRFREERSGVDLRLLVHTSAALLQRLEAFELDLAFVVGPLEGDYQVVEVLDEPLYLYVPRLAGQELAGGRELGAVPGGLADARRVSTPGSRDPGCGRRSPSRAATPRSAADGRARPRVERASRRRSRSPESRVLTPYAAAPVATRTLLGVRRRRAAPDARAEAFLRLAGASPRATPPSAT